MTADTVAPAIFYALLLILPLSALAGRRLGWRSNAKMALGWVAIFAIVGLIAIEGDRIKAVGGDIRRAFDSEAGETRGATLRIPMAEDGHFWIRAEVNGQSVRFLVDSGATTTALGEAAARQAGVKAGSGPISGIGVPIETANGTVIAHRATIERLRVGGIERQDFATLVAPEFGATNVLGMNFLSSLTRWGVDGETLVLTP